MREIFSFEQSISNAFAKYEICECVTGIFVKVSRVGSAVQKKQTCGKILAGMLRDGQHENTHCIVSEDCCATTLSSTVGSRKVVLGC